DGVPNGMRWLLQPVHHRNRTECRDFRSPFRNAGKKINTSSVKTSNEPIDEGRLWYSLLFHQFYPSILRPPFLCLIGSHWRGERDTKRRQAFFGNGMFRYECVHHCLRSSL